MYEVTNQQFCKFLNEYRSPVVKTGEFSGEPLLFESEGGIHMNGVTWTVKQGLEDCPVCNVTWFGANEFCRVKGFRLPTEAEWEYAARVQGKKVQFANGKDLADPEDMNYDASNDTLNATFSEVRNRGAITRVGIFPPNGLGLYDMSGNAWEWCQDWYNSEYYASLFADAKPDPAGPWFGNYKVIRGGGYGNNAHGIRTTGRSFMHPGRSNPDIGFRAVRK
jgi:formylglycine-generating enzyme required for sulfatase activity